MKPFEQKVDENTQDLTRQVKKILEDAFQILQSEVDTYLNKIVDSHTYSSAEEKQTTFEVIRNYFWLNYEAYLDPASRAFRIRQKPNTQVNSQSVKDFLDGLDKTGY